MFITALIVGVCITLIGYHYAVKFGKEDGEQNALDQVRLAYEENPTETITWLRGERETLPYQ
jgi:hypothetical protein